DAVGDADLDRLASGRGRGGGGGGGRGRGRGRRRRGGSRGGRRGDGGGRRRGRRRRGRGGRGGRRGRGGRGGRRSGRPGGDHGAMRRTRFELRRSPPSQRRVAGRGASPAPGAAGSEAVAAQPGRRAARPGGQKRGSSRSPSSPSRR